MQADYPGANEGMWAPGAAAAGYTDAGYTDAGYTDAGYTDAGYSGQGYSGQGYAGQGYQSPGAFAMTDATYGGQGGYPQAQAYQMAQTQAPVQAPPQPMSPPGTRQEVWIDTSPPTPQGNDKKSQKKAAKEREKAKQAVRDSMLTAAKQRSAAAANRPKLHTFQYVVTTAAGTKKKGSVRAYTIDQARALIAPPGGSVDKLKMVPDVLTFDIGSRRVKRQELIIFTRQLAAFIRAGVPLVDALASIGNESASKALQDTLRQITLDLAQGLPLSIAMNDHPYAFPKVYVDLIKAGEVTGNLDVVLGQAARYLTRREEAKRKIRAALAYPSVIAMTALFAVAVLVGFVLPKFVDFFKQFNAKLPLPTRVMLATSDFIQHWGLVCFVLAAMAVVAFALALRMPGFKLAWDRFVLALPLIGKTVQYSISERFCGTLATMVAAGVPLVTTFQVVIDSTKNLVFQKGLTQVREAMLVGQGMSGPLAASDLFPAMVPQMVRVGEDTGTLDEQLNQASDFFAEEIDYLLSKITAIFEPMIIIFVGGFIGFVGLALVSAMYGIYKQVGT